MLTLRHDLDLLESDRAHDGSRRWVLRDPVNNRFYKLGDDEIKVLACLKDTGLRPEEADGLGETLSRRFGRHFDSEKIRDFLVFLRQNNLLVVNGAQARALLKQQREHLQPGPFKALLRNYLFLRVHLLRPNRVLDRMLPWCRWCFRRCFWVLIGLNALIGIFLTSRQWDSFHSSFVGYLTVPGFIAIGVALALVKILHELGHALATRYYGCSVNSMGVAFLLFWPVLFTDTTDAWRLRDRYQRAVIGLSGVLVELAVASISLTAWHIAAEGMLKSVLFVLASTTWLLTLAINLNPLMRFDGYFVLADLLGMENLQERSFAMARWKLREWMFGFGFAPPERAPMGLILFAFATWVYRLLLYLGIALIIYHYFFKLLGLLLMTAQLYTFLVKPLSRELLFWWRNRGRSRLLPNVGVTFALLGGFLLWLVLPSEGSLMLPAYSRAPETLSVYVQEPGRLVALAGREGARVAPGDVLAELDMPDLRHQLAQAERDIALLEAQLRTLGVSTANSTPRGVLAAELRSARQQRSDLEARLGQRLITAPFGGTVRDLADDLTLQQWIGKGKQLMTLVQTGRERVVAYVGEADIGRVRLGQRGRFHADGGASPVLALEVIGIESFPVERLEELYVASSHGGGLQVRDGEEQGSVVPQGASYRVLLQAEGAGSIDRALRGGVVLATEPASPLRRYWRKLIGLWRREAGF